MKTARGRSLSVKGKGHVSANGIKIVEVLYVPGLTEFYFNRFNDR